MASGVKVQDECRDAFQTIKLKKNQRYIVFRISKGLDTIEIEKQAPPECTYDDLVEDFKKAEADKECRYAVFDAKYQKEGKGEHNKLCFIVWSPDTATVKQKMLYSSSKDALKKALGDGIAKEVQANDHSDLAWDNVLEQISRMDRH
jgi:cofilin